MNNASRYFGPNFSPSSRASVLLLLFICCFPSSLVGQRVRVDLNNPCHKNRAVFDIGSATTKLLVAAVDTCQKRVVYIHEDVKVPVRYREDMIINSSDSLGKDIQVRGLQVLKSLKIRARKHKPSNYVAFYSRTLQRAKNGSGFLNAIEKDTKIQFVVLTKEQEAKLIYQAAIQFVGGDKSKYLVWDIGASQQRLSFQDKNGKFAHFFSPTAAVTFRDSVIDLTKTKTRATPNPLGEKGAKMAQQLAHELAKKELVPSFLEIIKDKQLVGVGGVHDENFKANVRDKDNYNRQELKEAIDKNFNKSDARLGGPFASMSVTNMILVLSYMNVMKKDSVRTQKTNMMYGVLVDEDYW